VNLAGRKARPLAESLGSLPERFTRHGFDALRVGKRIVADVNANWKLLVENFSECFHCPPVHPELCRIVTAYRDAGAWGLHRDANGLPLPESQPEYKAGARTLTLDGTARLAARLRGSTMWNAPRRTCRPSRRRISSSTSTPTT
jgi:Rieske 2Fe-2S family protein